MTSKIVICILLIWFAIPAQAQQEFPCGLGYHREVQDGDSYWIVAENEMGILAPCHVETGEYLAPLSDAVASFYYLHQSLGRDAFSVFMSVSPDGRYILFTDVYDEQDLSLGTKLYYNIITSYDTETGEFTQLGNVGGLEQRVFVDRWLTDRVAIIEHGGSGEFFPTRRSVAVLDEPASLEIVITGRSRWYENPGRYEYFETWGHIREFSGTSIPPGEITCSLEVYQLATGTITYELGFDCLLREIVRYQNYNYFLLVDSVDDDTAQLRRLDVITGETETIYEGEIESIEYATIDGQSLNLHLIVDDSGKVDSIGKWDNESFCGWADNWTNPERTTLQINQETDEQRFIEADIPTTNKYDLLTRCMYEWLEENEATP